MSLLTSVEMIECWLHHDAWCKHWRSSSLIKNNGVPRGRNAEEHSDSTRPADVDRNPSLMSISTSRKSSNEHRFFLDVTSGSKIGKGRIRDLAGDVLFPVTCKRTIPTTIPTVTMINPRHCWCVMSNKALTDIINCANPPRPWTGVLIPRVLANRTSRWSKYSFKSPAKT